MGFKYNMRSPEALDKRTTQTATDMVGFVQPKFPFYKVQNDNWLRILPPTWDDAAHYGLDVYVHFNVGPNNASVLCTSRMDNLDCPVCRAQAEAEAAGREEEARELRAVKRVLTWVIDRKNEDKGPLVYAMPWTLDRDICLVSKDKRTGEVYLLDHPDQGYDISFDRTGEKRNVKYVGIQISKKASSVSQQALDYIQAHPLPSILWKRTPAEVAAIFGARPAGGVADTVPFDGAVPRGTSEVVEQRPSREDMFAIPDRTEVVRHEHNSPREVAETTAPVEAAVAAVQAPDAFTSRAAALRERMAASNAKKA